MFRNPLLLVLSILLSATAFSPLPSPLADGLESGDKIIILVRHAEKCTEPSDNPPLTPLGRERAQALVRTLTDFAVDAIYSTPFERTLQTVRPLAVERGLDIAETPIRSGFLEAMTEDIRSSEHQAILVSGHSNTTPRVVNMLAGTDYEDLEETEYDRLYIVHLADGGAAQVTILRYGPASGPSESAC